jgi:hypothetical protein
MRDDVDVPTILHARGLTRPVNDEKTWRSHDVPPFPDHDFFTTF